MTRASYLRELPFNGVPAPVMEPDPHELIRLVERGWLMSHRMNTKPGIAPPMADSRLCLQDLIVIMAKPHWLRIFSHYAQLAIHQYEGRNNYEGTIERAFRADGIKDAISRKIAELAVPA